MSCCLLYCNGGSFASMDRLCAGVVLKAPRAILRASL